MNEEQKSEKTNFDYTSQGKAIVDLIHLIEQVTERKVTRIHLEDSYEHREPRIGAVFFGD